MTNNINYLNHILAMPHEIKIRFDQISSFALTDTMRQGLSKLGLDPDQTQEQAVRVAQISLPFFCLYQPIGQAVAVTTGGTRVVCHMSQTYAALKKGDWDTGKEEMLKTSVAVFLVCSTYFEFKIGLLLNNGYDTTLGIVNVASLLIDKEYTKAAEESLQVLASALYIAYMLTGELEYMMALLLIQGVISLYQSQKEFNAEKYPEAAAAFVMSMIRFTQAKGCYEEILQRDFLLSIEKCQELFERAIQGKEVRDLLESEFNDLEAISELSMATLCAINKDQIIQSTKNAKKELQGTEFFNLEKSINDHQVIFKGADGKEYNFGAYFHEYGKGLVKGANLEFRKVTVGGKELYELEFKVNAYFRDQIETIVNDYKAMQSKHIKAVLKSAHTKTKDIIVSNDLFTLGNQTIGEAHVIDLVGQGKVMIGCSEKYPGLMNRVVVQMDKKKNLFDLNEILALTGLDTAIRHSGPDDMERLKIGHLYRVFFPQQATPFERTKEFFSLPVEQLKTKIIGKTPEMKDILNEYLHSMSKWEILPGKIRYKISGLADELRNQGALFLTAAITGVYQDFELISRTTSILSMGMLSNETRSSHGLTAVGLSPQSDFKTGAADSIFTQMVTTGHASDNNQFNWFYYYSGIRLIIDLEAIETGTYQYHYDSYGSRIINDYYYLQRPGVVEFVQDQACYPTYGNEVMLKERVPPTHIKKIIAETPKLKSGLIDQMRQQNLLATINGVECFNDIPIDCFVTTNQCIV